MSTKTKIDTGGNSYPSPCGRLRVSDYQPVSKLLPCPFCGFIDCVSQISVHCVVCKNCDGEAPARTWNTRAPSAQLAAKDAEIAELAVGLSGMAAMYARAFDNLSNGLPVAPPSEACKFALALLAKHRKEAK